MQLPRRGRAQPGEPSRERRRDRSNSDCNQDFFWSVKTPGNVAVHDSRNVTFSRCEFARMGAAALDVSHSSGVRVDGCFLHDISGSAIQIGSFQDALASPGDSYSSVTHTIVSRAAAEYSGAVGISVGYTVGTLLEHNDVSNLTYAGISVGWGWSRHECAACTNAGGNTIRANRVHGYKQALNDGGGIYMLGPQNGSVVSRNWVYDQGSERGARAEHSPRPAPPPAPSHPCSRTAHSRLNGARVPFRSRVVGRALPRRGERVLQLRLERRVLDRIVEMAAPLDSVHPQRHGLQ